MEEHRERDAKRFGDAEEDVEGRDVAAGFEAAEVGGGHAGSGGKGGLGEPALLAEADDVGANAGAEGGVGRVGLGEPGEVVGGDAAARSPSSKRTESVRCCL